MAFPLHFEWSACGGDGGSRAFLWGSGFLGTCETVALFLVWGWAGGLTPRAQAVIWLRQRERGPREGMSGAHLTHGYLRHGLVARLWSGFVQIISSCQTSLSSSESQLPQSEDTLAWTGCMRQVFWIRTLQVKGREWEKAERFKSAWSSLIPSTNTEPFLCGAYC